MHFEVLLFFCRVECFFQNITPAKFYWLKRLGSVSLYWLACYIAYRYDFLSRMVQNRVSGGRGGMPRRDVNLDYFNVGLIFLARADPFIACVKLVLNVVFHFCLVLVL